MRPPTESLTIIDKLLAIPFVLVAGIYLVLGTVWAFVMEKR